MENSIPSSPPRSRPGTAGTSVIADGVSITGDLVGENELQIDGNVEGKIKCGRITIGKGGSVNGQIKADTVMISGSFKGKISAGTLNLSNTARVDGSLVVKDSLAIEAGAHFEGQCQRPPNKGDVRTDGDKVNDIKTQFGAGSDDSQMRKAANA